MDIIVKPIHSQAVHTMCRRNALLLSLVVNLVISVSEVVAINVTTTAQFTKEIGCYATTNQSLVLAKCLVRKESKSLLQCITLCSTNSTCYGGVWNNTGSCYFYTVCDYITLGNCSSQGVNRVTIYRKQVNYTTSLCGTEGTFNPMTNKCTCSPGWYGVNCDIPPRICSDPANTTGVFWMDVKLSGLVRVLCDVATSDSFKIYAFKNDGTSHHNKTWAQYSQGYYVDENNFWVGLENMRTIISQNVTSVRLEVVFSNNSIYHYWDYTGVSISNSSTNYAVSFLASKINGSQLSWITLLYQNCLTSGKQFSTVDVDNDGEPLNLAAQGNAGWWFDATSIFNMLICNPMGRLPSLMQYSSNPGKMVIAGLDIDTGKYVSFFRYVAMYFYK